MEAIQSDVLSQDRESSQDDGEQSEVEVGELHRAVARMEQNGVGIARYQFRSSISKNVPPICRRPVPVADVSHSLLGAATANRVIARHQLPQVLFGRSVFVVI
ncbi:hypothetical protein [Schlesneria paludicola]|uniref:hypothetical protein n=1 Tax=Schlesneria paludicola TaxID=360056 RepID=UPI00029AE95E|nr:hypothetical protein [Schlesneria paludicola]